MLRLLHLNYLLQHIRKSLPTKLAGLKNSVRGPVVGPHWYSLF